MGLAASQARFLAITSRKADCEFRSMQIAQNKLSVTRDMAKISDDYQNSLNATKLVWDYDCDDGEACGNATNLSYSTLMIPGEANNYTPYLVTDRSGAVVLDGALATAAQAVCPDGKHTERNQDGFQKFINALAATGVISTDTATSIKDAGYVVYKDKKGNSYVYNSEETAEEYKTKYGLTYVTEGYDYNAGFGSTPLAKNEYLACNKYAYAKQHSKDRVFGTITYNDDGTETYESGLNAAAKSLLSNESSNLKSHYELEINGSVQETSMFDNLTIDKLLNNEVVLAAGSNYTDSDKDSSAEAIKNLKYVMRVAFNNICAGIFGRDYSEAITLDETEEGNPKFEISADASKNTVEWRAIKLTWDKFMNTVSANNLTNGANENLAIVAAKKELNNSDSNYYNASVSLSNMLSCLLTYNEVLNNYSTTEYSIQSTLKVSDSVLVTDDDDYEYVTEANNSTTQTDLLFTDFYMQLYNNICTYGWTTAENDIDQDQYFEQLIRNGTYFISTFGEDGYFYQNRYNDVDCVVEVVDEDAIARAEAEFTAEKAKLTYQEDRLDLEMKNIETEISSLTTELDSVKNLVSKSVEKTFTMFQ